jgi:hypothetical protein
MIYLLLSSALALAAPRLEPAANYPVNPEWKDAAPLFLPLDDFRVEAKTEIHSFRGAEKEPNVRSVSTHQIRAKSLAPAADIKRTELEFEKFAIASVLPLPGMKKPFENKQDFGVALGGKKIVMRWKENRGVGVEGLADMKAKLKKEVKDPVANYTLAQTLSEDLITGSFPNYFQTGACLQSLEKKKPGENWRAELVSAAGKTNVECAFEGWAESKGTRILVLHFEIPKQKTPPASGTTDSSELSAKGTLVWDPSTRETLKREQSTVVISKEESGQARPGSRSEIKGSVHHYPL